MYCKLAIIDHPDRNLALNLRSCDCAMRVLSRSIDLVMTEMKFESIEASKCNEEDLLIDRTLFFDVRETSSEWYITVRRAAMVEEEKKKNF